jgi:amidase
MHLRPLRPSRSIKEIQLKNPIASKAKPAASRAGNRNKAIAARVDQELDAFPYGSATALARALRTRKVSAVELLKATLGRVDRINPRLNAIVVDDRERAMAAARTADRLLARGELLGPLHGLPMTVKESFDLAGQPTTHGYGPMRQNIAPADALVVQRLKAAGAVIFGKTNVPLFLADFQSYNEIYGTTNNPWDLTRTPGGSSGGSAAAVAAGLTGLEYGSDIGGSIRNPAAYCGVYGHKCTWTIVPKRGHTLSRTPVTEVDLSVVGPIARSADDLALALRVTAGPDLLTSAGIRFNLPAPPRSLKGLRVAVWADDALAPVDASVRSAIHDAALALRAAGARINFDARPAFDAPAAHATYVTLLMAIMGTRRPDYEEMVAARAALAANDQSPRAQQLRASTSSFKSFAEASNRREQLRWAWQEFFGSYDVLLAPITVTPAFVQDQSEPADARTLIVNGVQVPYFSQTFWAGIATCAYLPATAVPIGQSALGLPIGLQIIGPELADRTTIWLASQLAKLIGGYVPPPVD